MMNSARPDRRTPSRRAARDHRRPIRPDSLNRERYHSHGLHRHGPAAAILTGVLSLLAGVTANVVVIEQ